MRPGLRMAAGVIRPYARVAGLHRSRARIVAGAMGFGPARRDGQKNRGQRQNETGVQQGDEAVSHQKRHASKHSGARACVQG